MRSLQVNSDFETWKVSVPILVAVTAFIANIIYQAVIKQRNAKDKLGNEIIQISDQMLWIYADVEREGLLASLYVSLRNITLDKKNFDLYDRLFFYHFQKENERRYLYHSRKSDLISLTKDFKKYWKDSKSEGRILLVMSRLSHINPRFFIEEFKSLTTEQEIRAHHKKLSSKTSKYAFFEAVGVSVVYLQRLVDPNLPLLYISPGEDHDELIKMLKEYETNLTSAVVEPNHFEI